MKRVTQADVAKLADVSISTVSRALSNSEGISPDLRQRIKRIASELSYADKTGNSRKALVYLPMYPLSGGLHPYWQAMFDGLRDAADDLNFKLTPRLVPEAEFSAALVRREAESSGAGAVIVFYMSPGNELVQELQTIGPLVLVATIDSSTQHDSVDVNDYAAGRLAVMELIGRGHTNIAFVTGAIRHAASERIRAMRDAEAEYGIKASLIEIEHNRLETSYAHFSKAFAGGALPEQTAFFCYNDLIAVGALQAASEVGIKVPEDLSILGFENAEVGKMTSPRIATYDFDRRQMGDEVIRLLEQRLAGRKGPGMRVVMGVSFVSRNSISGPQR